jgi:hypothetical protein
MMKWAVNYVERTRDPWGGASHARTNMGVTFYPKLTNATASTLQAMIDVWIDIGPEVYWNDSLRLYQWMVGTNEMSTDLQSAPNIVGEGRGFYEGIGLNGLMAASDLSTTALALYAIIRAGFVRIPGQYPIPEFPAFPINAAFVLSLVSIVLSAVGRKRMKSSRLGVRVLNEARNEALWYMSTSNYPS